MKIVFLHGLGQDEQSWKDVISYLPNSYSCKSLSLFNHLNSTDTATLDDLTKYIEVQLNQIKEPFILCGLSLGAVIALNYLATPSPYLKKVVLVAPQFESPNRLLLTFQNIYFYCVPSKIFEKLGLSKKQTLTLLRSLETLDCKTQLRTSRLPKLILCGTKDHANKPAAKRLYKLSTNGRLLFIKNGKHELNREKPEIMAQAMRSFIENS